MGFERELSEADYYVAHNLIETAMPIYQKLLDSSDNTQKAHVLTHRSMAIICSDDYFESHRQQAIDDAEAAFRADPNSIEALNWILEMYRRLGNDEKVAYYQKYYDQVTQALIEADKRNQRDDDIGSG